MNENKIKRTQEAWSKIAGESVSVVQIKDAIYAFGSELAMLRLEHKLRSGRAGWSENMQTWYYCVELKF